MRFSRCFVVRFRRRIFAVVVVPQQSQQRQPEPQSAERPSILATATPSMMF